MKKVVSIALVITLLAGIPVFAASEIDTAASYLKELGILAGDEHGNLNLDKTLTRAELAVILTRLDYLNVQDGFAEWDAWGKAHFSDPANRYNSFTDVPDWAMPFVEYCYQCGFMAGVGDNRFDPQGKVSPKMAATVLLRYVRLKDADWDYHSSVSKAQSLGIAPIDGVSGEVVTRGTMAVMIQRAIQYDQARTVPVESSPEPTPSQPVTPEPTPEIAAMTIEEMKLEIVRLTNIERVKAGVPKLEILPELMDCAQAKADDMKAHGYYGHMSPKYGTAGEMIKSYVPNSTVRGENLAPWTKTPAEAFAGWVISLEHLDNVLEPRYTHLGIGVIEGAEGGYWWTQQFAAIP